MSGNIVNSMSALIHTHSTEETRKTAAELARGLAPGSILALYGDLGAGKTCFIQGLASGLNIKDPVVSPTYTLVREYKGRLPLHHIDLYRIRSPEEAFAMGLDEYLYGDGITAIEWADRVESELPETTIRITLEPGETDDERVIKVEGKIISRQERNERQA